jgi:hypothetical protein
MQLIKGTSGGAPRKQGGGLGEGQGSTFMRPCHSKLQSSSLVSHARRLSTLPPGAGSQGLSSGPVHEGEMMMMI